MKPVLTTHNIKKHQGHSVEWALSALLHRANQLLMNRHFLNILIVCAVVMGVVTYHALSQQSLQALHPRSVQMILNIDFCVLLCIFIAVAHRLIRLWNMRRRKAAGAALHTRLVALFALLTILPAVVMGVLMALFFHAGVESWFDDKVKTALTESQAVADAYLEEHKNVIKVTTDAMARTIDQLFSLAIAQSKRLGMQLGSHQIPISIRQLNDFIDAQAMARGLTEALIFDFSLRVVAQSHLTFSLGFVQFTPLELKHATSGVVTQMNPEGHWVRALTVIDEKRGLFLLVGRPLDPQILKKISQTKKAVMFYEELAQELGALSIQLTIVFGLITLLLVMVAILIGLVASNKIADPIAGLIAAAEHVSRGNLNIHLKVTDDWEMGQLSRTFNKMTSDLSVQQQSLMQKNRILDQRRQFIEAVLGGVTSGVLSIDRNCIVRSMNHAAYHILAIDAKNTQAIQQPLHKVFPESYKAYRAAQGKDSFRTRIPIVRHNKPLDLMLRLMAIGDKPVSGYIMTVEDITDLIRAQRQAAWTNVARWVAHEIKNPLTPIQLAAERLQKKFAPQISDDADNFQKCIETITRQVKNMGNMATAFSDFARFPLPNFQEVDFVKIVKENIVLFEQAHPHILFHTHVPTTILLHADPDQVSRVLTNLCKNSVQAMCHQKKQEIFIWIVETPKNVLFSFQDSGPGFLTEHMSQLTKPYITHKKNGTGLGLAIVQKIVEEHSATMILDNGKHGARIQIQWNKSRI